LDFKKEAMIHEIEKFIKGELSSKPTWSSKELTAKLQSISTKLSEVLEDEGKIVSVSSSKRHTVSVLKKYDIIYVSAIGVPHYFMVHRVVGEIVYGVIFTTKTHDHFFLHIVKGDRIFGNVVSNTYLSISKELALKSYIRVYEDKKEAEEIFRKLKDHYRTLFLK
jgi:hypothetical protein